MNNDVCYLYYNNEKKVKTILQDYKDMNAYWIFRTDTKHANKLKKLTRSGRAFDVININKIYNFNKNVCDVSINRNELLLRIDDENIYDVPMIIEILVCAFNDIHFIYERRNINTNELKNYGFVKEKFNYDLSDKTLFKLDTLENFKFTMGLTYGK